MAAAPRVRFLSSHSVGGTAAPPSPAPASSSSSDSQGHARAKCNDFRGGGAAGSTAGAGAPATNCLSDPVCVIDSSLLIKTSLHQAKCNSAAAIQLRELLPRRGRWAGRTGSHETLVSSRQLAVLSGGLTSSSRTAKTSEPFPHA